MRIDENGRYYLTEEEKEKLRDKAKGRSLAEMNPELAAQWNYELNGDLEPDMVTYGSHLKVWWIEYYDVPMDYHIAHLRGKHFDLPWDATVNDRNRGNGNPYLASGPQTKIIIGFNDFMTTHPEIAKDWDYVLNGDLKPTDVTAGSKMKVWWSIKTKHPVTNEDVILPWLMAIQDRVRGRNCPYLSGRAVLQGFNDIKTLNPSLAEEWDYILNGDLTPEMFTANSRKKVWWLLTIDDPITKEKVKESWMATICDRNAGHSCKSLYKSRTEWLVQSMLRQLNISFITEQKFKNCKNKFQLPFDIFINDEVLVEIDGIQHFTTNDFWGGNVEFSKVIIRDNIKTNYCFDNKIPLLRIPYIYDPNKDKNKIEQLILNFIQTKQVPQEIIDFYSQFPFSDYGKILQKQNP